jgi:ribonuclease HII
VALQNYYKQGVIEAGCDEAGRGCLAGPVFAAAVILPPDFHSPLLNDSKQLTALQRDKLRIEIEMHAQAYAISRVEPAEIDKINIFKASIQAMHQAIGLLRPVPEHLLIDGKFFYSYKDISHQCIIKGDGKYLSIAAASVLAKTYRDEYMTKIHDQYPSYNWKKNKGYPTRAHRDAIRKYGITPHHRKSFRLLPEAQQLKIKDLK